MRNFRHYRVWHDCIRLIDNIYELSRALPSHERYVLVTQLRRSAISTASNLAEGCGRDSQNEFRRFVEFALSSAYKVETQIIVAERQYPNCWKAGYAGTLDLLHKVQAQLNALRNKLK